jgi:hypothetical protein
MSKVVVVVVPLGLPKVLSGSFDSGRSTRAGLGLEFILELQNYKEGIEKSQIL